PGDTGTITTSTVTPTSLTLNWTAATDNVSLPANLRYFVYQSASAMNDIATAEGSTLLNAGGALDIATLDVTGLSPSTNYHFNIVVVDEANQKALYSNVSQTTPGDTTVPTPGNSGNLASSLVTESGFTISWTAASDNVSLPANLNYRVFYSTTNNLGSVSNVKTLGTEVGVGANDITSRAVTGLNPSFTYYFNVLVKDEAGNEEIYVMNSVTTTADTTAPVPGNSGNLASSSVTDSGFTISWTTATDTVTAQANLSYRVFYSTTNNLGSVANVKSLGTEVGVAADNITSRAVTGLNPSFTYYFNVLVKDQAGNEAIYVMNSVTTSTDGTPPSVGGGGTISSASVTGTSLTLNWTTATDNGTAAASLMYYVYQSGANDIDTVANAEGNGTLLNAGGTANIATFNVTGLTGGTTYWFNVVVLDGLNNKASYTSFSVTTTAAGPTYSSTINVGANGISRAANVVVDDAAHGRNIYVTDNGLTTTGIYKYNSAGVFQSSWGTTMGARQADTEQPDQMAFNNTTSELYVAEYVNHRIHRYDNVGGVPAVLGCGGVSDPVWDATGGGANKCNTSGSPPGSFTNPAGIALDGSGNIYVSSAGLGHVQMHNSAGVHQWTLTYAGFSAALYGVAVDASGNIYVADVFNHQVHKFNSSRVFQYSIGTSGVSGTGDGEFNGPRGIAVDSAGNLYVADAGNNRIQKFDSSGNFVWKYGSLGTANNQFNTPSGIWVDDLGKVYVADRLNARVQILTQP
ncbi:MAG: hypothetical protein OEZ36_04475, partial [Spirochaetota bacterium]|nr:hypothetical protein [Spirochaetota bacterium]